MSRNEATELILLRHAPLAESGRLFGRSDAAADLSDTAAVAALRATLPDPARLLSSPAKRCRDTAEAIFDRAGETDPDLWEQDFGDWEGRAYADVPDLGPLTDDALADHRPPGGESFRDLTMAAGPRHVEALDVTYTVRPGPVVIVAHAGTIRAALSVALGGTPRALRFEVPTLSTTALTRLPDGGFAIRWVNRPPR